MNGNTNFIIITNEFPPVSGGVGSYCKGFAAALRERGAGVVVVAARKTNQDDAHDRALPYSVVRTRQKIPFLRHLFRAIALCRVARSNPNAVIWAAEWRSGLVAAFISKLLRREMIITIHGTELLELDSSLVKRTFATPVYRRAAKIIAISDYVGDLIHAKAPDLSSKVVVVKNGINPSQFSGVGRDEAEELLRRNGLSGKKIVLSLCRLVPRKGVDQTLEAFALLSRNVKDVALVIAGTGPESDALKKRANDLGIKDKVLFTGYVPDEEVPVWYHAATIYIMLSRKDDFFVEGFGLTFLEANACGKPVIGGDHGGVPEAIVEGETGYVVDPNDAGSAAQAMERLLSDPALYAAMARAGRELVNGSGSWARAADELIALYDGGERLAGITAS